MKSVVLLILMSTVAATAIGAADAMLEQERRTYNSGLERENKRHETEVNRLKGQLLSAYRRALDRSLAAKDLEAANRLKLEMESIEQEAAEPLSAKNISSDVGPANLRPGSKKYTISLAGKLGMCVGEEMMIAKLVSTTTTKGRNTAAPAFKVVKGLGSAKGGVSLESTQHRDHFLFHSNFLMKYGPDAAIRNKDDGTFMMVPGLADPICVSFRSVNWPSHYISVNDKDEVWIMENPPRESATFILREAD